MSCDVDMRARSVLLEQPAGSFLIGGDVTAMVSSYFRSGVADSEENPVPTPPT